MEPAANPTRLPTSWFVGSRGEDSYLEMHLIPRDRSLWNLERFDDFIAERKKLIAEKFGWLLVPPTQQITQRFSTSSRTNYQKSMTSLIDAGILADEEILYLTYKGRTFTAKARRNGVELGGDGIFSPSAAAIRCYEQAGASRPTENGWQVWKNSLGKNLNELFAESHSITLEELELQDNISEDQTMQPGK